MAKPELGKFGVFGHYAQWQQVPPDQLREIEALGYGAIWPVGRRPPSSTGWIPSWARPTSWRWPPASSTSGPPRQAPRRRVVPPHRRGIPEPVPAGHRRRPPPEAHAEYKKPYDALTEYLDELDRYGVPPKDRRVVAALGPQVLKLSARRSAGAHPYLTTPEHTRQARELVGPPDAFIAPEHKAVLTTDAEQARAVGRKALEIYLNLANYTNNWKRLGFTDADVAKPGSDALVDAVVAHGTVDVVAARLTEHLTAGADHVPVQVLTGTDKLVPALAELAGPLGLR